MLIKPTKKALVNALGEPLSVPGSLAWDRGGGAPPLPLETQIIAEYTAAGWTVGGLFLARAADLTLVGGKIDTWANLGTGGDATQTTDANRPTWDAAGLGTGGSAQCDGGDHMTTAAIDSGSATGYVLHVLFTDSDTAARFVTSFGDIGAGEGIALKTNDVASAVGCQTRTTAVSRVYSAGSYPMTTAAVVTATWDTDLAASETEIRHAGVNVSATRPVDGNNSAGAGSQIITIGAREGPANNMAGDIAAVVVAWGTGSIPTTQVGNVETLLADAWGV